MDENSPLPDLARFAVVDLETTGFSPTVNDIVEVAVVHAEGPTLVLETLVRPHGRLANWSIHGIGHHEARTAPRFAEIAGDLLDALVGRIVVAHNARFDIPFLEQAFVGIGVDLDLPGLCTLRLHRKLFGRRQRLEQACAELEVPFRRDRHRAADDAMATALLLRAQIARFAADAGPHPFEAVLAQPVLGEELARSVPGRGALKPRVRRAEG